jgi:hypothetical protein
MHASPERGISLQNEKCTIQRKPNRRENSLTNLLPHHPHHILLTSFTPPLLPHTAYTHTHTHSKPSTNPRPQRIPSHHITSHHKPTQQNYFYFNFLIHCLLACLPAYMLAYSPPPLIQSVKSVTSSSNTPFPSPFPFPQHTTPPQNAREKQHHPNHHQPAPPPQAAIMPACSKKKNKDQTRPNQTQKHQP